MSPARMCSLATRTASWYASEVMFGGHLGHDVVGSRRLQGRPTQRTGQVGGQVVEARPGRVEGGRGLGLAPVLAHDDVVHQHDTLAPVVEGAQLPDHVQHGVGEAGVVTGHVGEMLDLAHDVVAQIPHEPAVQRGQVGQDR